MERGWESYEWRLRSGALDGLHEREAPLWTGEALAGRRLLVWAEQGLGDTLQFVRYAVLLAGQVSTSWWRSNPSSSACCVTAYRKFGWSLAASGCHSLTSTRH